MQYTNDQIERYLNNQMSGEELSQFTLQLVMNPQLRQEVEGMRMVFKTLKTSGGTTFPSGTSSRYRFAFYLLGGILILAFSLWLFQGKATNEDFIPKEEIELPEVAPKNVPIAEAFLPNDYLEQALHASRSEVNLVIEKPQNGEQFKIGKDEVILHFKGNITKSIDASAVELTVWNNQKIDYQNERFIFKMKVPVKSELSIDFKTSNNLSKGLYYFQFNVEGKEAYYGKFEVVK